MSNKALIEKWIQLFNRGDAKALAKLYHLNAINHQVTHDPVEGKQAIEDMFRLEFEAADMTCIPDNIFEDGNWVILEWKDPLGLRGCGFFEIKNGLIFSQRGYWDKLSFLRMHKLPIPTE